MPLPEPFFFETRIRFIDTDASGRIHYTCLFRYFESAEVEFMRSLGIKYIGSQISFPRVHVECDYRLALVNDDLIRIEVCLTKLGRSSARLEFNTLKDGELAAHGVIVVACMDRRTQRAVPIPDDLRATLASALQGDELGEGHVSSGSGNP
jgi:YbgC/YbaW family acyl-CoA thioester hydrolase